MAGVVEPWAACLIGAIAGLIYIGGSKALLVLRLDDAYVSFFGNPLTASNNFVSYSYLLLAYS
jgi:hypothetical protein